MIKKTSFTEAEILSQPEVWKKTLQHLQNIPIDQFPDLSAYDQVIFTGCGSTFHLSEWAARQSEKTHGTFSRAVPASELFLFPECWLHKGKKSLLVAISRSAETTETIRALDLFISGNYGDTVVITCYSENHLAKLSPHVIDVPDAKEKSVAQTRSFSSMMLAASCLIHKRIPEFLPVALVDAGNRLLAEYASLATEQSKERAITKFFFLGSGPLYGLANECMLKMKEMSLKHSEAFHFMEFRHGPMSMIDKGSLVIGLLSYSSCSYELDLLRDMKAMGASIFALSEEKLVKYGDMVDNHIVFNSGLPDAWYAPLYLPILQLVAHEQALQNNLDPDNPNNLRGVIVLDD